jgi:hypothetical protein
MVRGTRHSQDSGMSGMRSVYAESTSLICLRIGECDYVSCGDDVVDANEGCAVAVGHDG